MDYVSQIIVSMIVSLIFVALKVKLQYAIAKRNSEHNPKS